MIRVGQCSMVYGYNKERRCALHGTPLTGRQQRWCKQYRSPEEPGCWQDYASNHQWGEARWEALRRACVEGEHRGRGSYTSALYSCALCECLFRDIDVEVDHIVPARGAHGQHSCIHHQANLRVLCIPCHRKVTAADAAKRAEDARLERERQQGLMRMAI